MALGSGSSFSTDCWTRRRDSPFALQSYAARAKPAYSTKSRHRNPLPRSRDDRLPSSSTGRAAFFSLVLRIGAGYPAFGPLPAHSQPRQGGPDGLARDPLFGEPFFEADLGSHLQSPKATLFAELARILVKHLPQSLGLLRIESPVNSMRMLRTWLKRFRGKTEIGLGLASTRREPEQITDLAVGMEGI